MLHDTHFPGIERSVMFRLGKEVYQGSRTQDQASEDLRLQSLAESHPCTMASSLAGRGKSAGNYGSCH